jgi:hypothetical protein
LIPIPAVDRDTGSLKYVAFDLFPTFVFSLNTNFSYALGLSGQYLLLEIEGSLADRFL